MTLQPKHLIIGGAVLIGLVLLYIFTPKPQPDVKLQVEYAKLQEHARMTDSLLQVLSEKSEEDSIALENAIANLQKLRSDSSKIKIIYEKEHAAVRAANLDETIRFSAGSLPESNPYK